MRKLIASLVVAALSVLTLGAPAHADDSTAVQVSLHYSTSTYMGDVWTPVGSQISVNFVDASSVVGTDGTVTCTWFSFREGNSSGDIDDLKDSGQDCHSPWIVNSADAGRKIFASGVVFADGSEVAKFKSEPSPNVKIEAKGVSLKVVPDGGLRYGKESTLHLEVSSGSDLNFAEPHWTAKVIDSSGQTTTLNRGYSLPANERHSFTPYDKAGSDFRIRVAFYARNVIPFEQILDLGTMRGIEHTGLVPPKIAIRGDLIDATLLGQSDQVSAYEPGNQFEWLVDGGIYSKGDSFTSLASLQDLSNRSVQLRVTYRKWGYEDLSMVSNAILVPKEKIIHSGNLLISGKFAVGSTVSVTPELPTIEGVSLSYQWFTADIPGWHGEAIKGASSPSLKITPLQAGKYLYVSVGMSHKNYISTEYLSDSIKIPTLKADVMKAPQIVGKLVVGNKVNFSPAYWNAPSKNDGSAVYSWYLDGKMIGHDFPLLLTASMAGKKLSIIGNGSVAGYEGLVARSKTMVIGKSTATVKGKLSKKSIKSSATSKLTVTVKTPGVLKPTGKVTVKVGKKTFTKTLKASAKGKVVFTLKALKAGKQQAVKVKFTSAGSTAKAVKNSSTTTVAKITVKKPVK